MAISLATSPSSAVFRAMGTTVHVVVFGLGAPRLVQLARSSIEQLERSWSRFLPDSDISRINGSPSRPVVVDPTTIDLVARAIDGWIQTDGVFDPTVGGSLRAAGYDRPFDELAPPVVSGFRPAPSPIDIDVHPVASTITVPAGVELDLGGIGKGAAADLTVRTLLEAGADGVMINLGGDLRAEGHGPMDGWHIILECPGSHAQREIRVGAGAVCTSSTVERRWTTFGSERHHIIEPATGRSVTTDLRTATVIGAEAVQCEILATTAIGVGLDAARQLIESHRACGLLIDEDGLLHEVGAIGAFR